MIHTLPARRELPVQVELARDLQALLRQARNRFVELDATRVQSELGISAIRHRGHLARKGDPAQRSTLEVQIEAPRLQRRTADQRRDLEAFHVEQAKVNADDPSHGDGPKRLEEGALLRFVVEKRFG